VLLPLLLDLGGGTAPPQILVQPTNEATQLGGTATFAVAASGSNLIYQWFLNGTAVPGATSPTFLTQPATAQDQGDQLFVIVSNGVGSVQSNTVLLTVVLPIIATVPPTPGVTSGTISQTVFNTEKVIASAMRRCRLNSGQITGEMLFLAQQQLYLYLSELSNAAVPLWCIDKQILPLYQGSNEVICPVGTIDVLNLMLRTLQFVTGTVVSSDGGNAASIQNQTTTSSYTQSAQNGSFTVTLPSGTNLTQFGLLPAATGNWNYSLSVSPDGINFTPIYTQTFQPVTSGVWQWLDIDVFTDANAGNLMQNVLAYQIQATGGTTLSVNQFLAANTPTEITMALINRDAYISLPNKDFQGQPVQYWTDKQYYQPILHIWPAPDTLSQFRQLILTRHRHIMDVGALPQIIEVPQRWLNAIVDKLAAAIAVETPEVEAYAIKRGEPPGITERLIARGNESEIKAWSRETDRSSTFLSAAIGCYTR
jgi:hypothetical protein